MDLAIKEAKKAELKDEVPIGAIIVKDGIVIARAHNLMEKTQLATAHAEIIAINKACKKLNSWRLDGAEIYVTLEPCPMCMGACLNARVDQVYFGAYEQKGRSLTAELAEANLLNHNTTVVGGVAERECAEILTAFFSSMRAKQKEEKKLKKEAQDSNLPKEI